MTQITEYNKVSFITSKSSKIPKVLRETGSLIVLSELNNKRTSLWLRNNLIASGWGLSTRDSMNKAEWMTYAYNKVFSPTDEGMSYFLPSEDVRDISYIEVKNNQVVGRPQSVHMLLSYGLNFTSTYCTDLSNQISDINKSNAIIKNDISYIKDIYIPNALDASYSYAYNIGKNVKDNSYAYTLYWANRIIGNSPEFLDSLEEIRDFLRHDKENSLNTLSKIESLDKMTVKRKEEEGSYTYIDYDRITYDYIDKSKEYTGTYTYTWYDDDGKAHVKTDTYTYYKTGTYTGGWLALKSEQVSTDDFFGHQQLNVILKRLLQPYPYEIPQLTSTIVNDLDPEEWADDVCEYGSSLGMNSFKVTIDAKTASKISGIRCIPSNSSDSTSKYSSNIQSNVTTEISSSFTKINVPTGSGSTEDICKYHELFSKYEISYNDANRMEYPQLVGLSPKVYDDANRYYAGSFIGSFTYPIRKKMSYKVFWGTTDDTIPNTDSLVVANNSKMIVSKESTGALVVDSPKSKIWVSFPSNMMNDIKVVMRSWISGIENDITEISTESLKKSTSSDGFTHNGTQYKVISLENIGFTTFAEKVSIEVFFNISGI